VVEREGENHLIRCFHYPGDPINVTAFKMDTLSKPYSILIS
jgi:hypothetical protein